MILQHPSLKREGGLEKYQKYKNIKKIENILSEIYSSTYKIII